MQLNPSDIGDMTLSTINLVFSYVQPNIRFLYQFVSVPVLISVCFVTIFFMLELRTLNELRSTYLNINFTFH